MSLERIVSLALLLIISVTIISLVFYEMSHSADTGSSKLKSSHSIASTSTKRQMKLLNESLTLLRNELQNIYRDHVTVVTVPLDSTMSQPLIEKSNLVPIAKPIMKPIKKPLKSDKAEVANVRRDQLGDIVVKDTPPTPALRASAKKTALLFTMDSISSYESASKKGGAAGELLIRHSLEKIFKELNVQLDVKTNDRGAVDSADYFESANVASYDIVIVDPWTWAAKGWVPKQHLVGMDSKIYVLSFFGSKKLRGSGLTIPATRFLTAYNTNPFNYFLGYYLEENNSENNSENSSEITDGNNKIKKQQGVIWGKDPNHFSGRSEMLKSIASGAHGVSGVQLVSTAQHKVFEHSNVRWLGHQTAVQWLELLSESKFLLGLGDPLLGPSAVDAISRGCMYINPVYDKPMKVNDHLFLSQHSYAADNIGEPYVCSYKPNDLTSLQLCVDRAMKTELKPFVPKEFTKEAYRQRVIKIFNL